jgi:hypothetical protein
MPRPALLVLAALIAAPAFALEEGTYPVTIGAGVGELELSERLLSLRVTSPASCEMSHRARLLRGPEGDWAGLIGEDCVLIGTRTDFQQIGAGCAAVIPPECELRGDITGDRTAKPVSVTPALLEWQFTRLPASDRRSIQRLLAREGHYKGSIDGAYGPGTEKALISRLQRMADQGEGVGGNDAFFIRDLIAELAASGRGLAEPKRSETADPIVGASGEPLYVGAWSCAGVVYRFTADGYRMTDEADGTLIAEGRLRPDGVEAGTAYLELVGYGNRTFFGVGTGEMFVHDPTNGESYDCFPR